jgi:methyl-accepting chemotaxis protein
MKKLRIAGRLLLGFGLLMLVIAGLSSFAVYSSNTAGTALANVVRFKNDEVQSQRVERRLMEARLAIWTGLATGDASNMAKADTALKVAFRRLDEMAAGTTDRKRLAAIEALKSAAAAFQAKAKKLQAVGGKNLALGSAENKAVAADAIATAGKASADAALPGGDYSHAAKSLES